VDEPITTRVSQLVAVMIASQVLRVSPDAGCARRTVSKGTLR